MICPRNISVDKTRNPKTEPLINTDKEIKNNEDFIIPCQYPCPTPPAAGRDKFSACRACSAVASFRARPAQGGVHPWFIILFIIS